MLRDWRSSRCNRSNVNPLASPSSLPVAPMCPIRLWWPICNGRIIWIIQYRPNRKLAMTLMHSLSVISINIDTNNNNIDKYRLMSINIKQRYTMRGVRVCVSVSLSLSFTHSLFSVHTHKHTQLYIHGNTHTHARPRIFTHTHTTLLSLYPVICRLNYDPLYDSAGKKKNA